ncbi:MAG: response regulator [Planctomycetota bacterium]|nr:response regulator [Planctomycetota bacterium]
MARSNRTPTDNQTKRTKGEDRTFRVLLVDHEPQALQSLAECLDGPHIELVQAPTLAAARKAMMAGPIDLALIEPNLIDGSGLTFATELRRKQPGTQSIVISGQPSLERAIEAIRAGVADFIVKPLDLNELNARVRHALANRRADQRRMARIQRLRRVCKKLNQARQEVSQQVDILCNDLVTAYQDLAAQMQQAVVTGEYALIARQELDLETLLRKTLEFILQKAGPTNAAIFLPSSADEYTLGGYVNYDCDSKSADMLLQHLADVVAPRLAPRDQPLHITDNDTLKAWIGDDSAYLADCHVLGFSSRHNGEPLAVLTMFRDQGQPFPADLPELCAAIAPMLGDYLSRIIRVHHRLAKGLEEPGT